MQDTYVIPRKYTVLIHIFESTNHSESEQYTFHHLHPQNIAVLACSAKSALCRADAAQGTRRFAKDPPCGALVEP